MEKGKLSVEFEAEVDKDGFVRIARPVGTELGINACTKVTVRIVPGILSKELAARMVTEEEIERIARVQFEDREHVVRFLEAEGALAKNSAFARRGRSAER